MDATVDIPDLKARAGGRERRRGAFLFAWPKEAPLVLAGFLLIGLAAGGRRVYERYLAENLSIGGVESTIRPVTNRPSLRLELATQAVKPGELKWSKPVDEAEARRKKEISEWAAVLDMVRGKTDRSSSAARGQSALDQLRLTDAVSDAASRQGGDEAQASLSHDAFAQQLTEGGGKPGIAVAGAVVDPASLKSGAPAAAPAVPARNVTPYQFALERAYELAREAGALRKRAPGMIAAGAALAAAGRAMLNAPGAGLAGRAMIAAGLLMASAGTKKLSQAKTMLAEAKELSAGIDVAHGQKAQRGLADVCLDLLARGQALERCGADQPGPWTELAHASQIRAEAAEAVWEVEGGKAYVRR
jgi:hypothetical protein